MTSAPWLAAQARRQPAGIATITGGTTTTWAALAERTERVAAGLAAFGVARGDIVAARAEAGCDFLALLHAAQLVGAALLPVNPRLAAPEIARLAGHVLPKLWIDPTGEFSSSTNGVASFDDVARRGAKSFSPASVIDMDAPLTIVATSGTTGTPKAVVLTSANHAASAAASALRLGHGAGDEWLATIPLFHVGGLAILARAAIDGSTVRFEPGFDADRCALALVRGNSTMISLVPTMLHRIVERLAEPVSPSIRAVLVGGAALAPSLARRALERGLPIAATYGMTEACSQIATSRPGSDDAARGLVGAPLDGVEVRIAPDCSTGSDGGMLEHVPPGVSGEIRVRGPNVMRGYLRNPDADRRLLADGWLATGDIGRLDERGALEVLGRSDDLIVTGGENVSPGEIERVLDEHPEVRESLVTALPDDEWGERIVALVVAAGNEPPPGELATWCRAHLAGYKIPREIRFVGELPRTATGKLQRKGAALSGRA